MLVLSRKVGEKILIGDKVEVTVVRVAQGVVRIGIDAPREMAIVRQEILVPLEEDAGPVPGSLETDGASS